MYSCRCSFENVDPAATGPHHLVVNDSKKTAAVMDYIWHHQAVLTLMLLMQDFLILQITCKPGKHHVQAFHASARCMILSKHLLVQTEAVTLIYKAHLALAHSATFAPAGIAYLEIQKGAFISAAVPVLVADRALGATEAPRLLEAAMAVDDAQASHVGIITDLALMALFSSQQPVGGSAESDNRDSSMNQLAAGGCSCHTCRLSTRLPSVSNKVVVATARRLLTLACQQGAQHLISYLLPIAVAAMASSHRPDRLPAAAASALEEQSDHSCQSASCAGSSSDNIEQKHPVPDSSASAHGLALRGTVASDVRSVLQGIVRGPSHGELAITAADSTGLTLLHHVVRSGNAQALDALLTGGKRLGINWQVSIRL